MEKSLGIREFYFKTEMAIKQEISEVWYMFDVCKFNQVFNKSNSKFCFPYVIYTLYIHLKY